MSTTPAQPAGLAASPAIPLTPELRAAYQALYNSYEAAIEGTTDVGALEALNASKLNVDDILTKDDLYRLEANTVLYQVLLTQINSTNLDLKALKAQILAISSGISIFGDVVAAIDKVLTMVPGL